ncbi:MAG: peptidoglycan DD-metalloendopeptidase family protein [Patescibacteria group bacterium]
MSVSRSTYTILAVLMILVLSAPDTFGGELSAEELQRQINEHNAQIAALDKEIAQYQVQLDAVGTKKKTLQNALSQLDLSIKKTNASISSTKSKIKTTQLEIQQLANGIARKETSIETGGRGLQESLRRLNETETEPLVVRILAAGDISDAWVDADATQTLQVAIGEQIDKLSVEKQSLTDSKTATEKKKAELVKQQNTLLAQQGSLNAQKKAQSELLAQTKSQESTYQSILAQKQAARASFEAALGDLKAQFQRAVNPSDILAAGKGILRWPVDNVRITQQFGNTTFAAAGAYNGKGHNGIDLAAPIGTPLRAALTGRVLGTGNTDSVRGCYSFGKWVMIQHNNGLNTMYSHLSQINVSTGQSVGTGEIIGYSGETGYATGPHLHFGVYVSSATQIVKLGSATNSTTPCAQAVMPVAPLAAYLNPMNYL